MKWVVSEQLVSSPWETRYPKEDCDMHGSFTFMCPLISKITYIRTLPHYTFIKLFDMTEVADWSQGSQQQQGGGGALHFWVSSSLNLSLPLPQNAFLGFQQGLCPCPQAAHCPKPSSWWRFAFSMRICWDNQCAAHVVQLGGEAERHVFVSQGLTKFGLLEKRMANHISIVALRTPEQNEKAKRYDTRRWDPLGQ